MAARKKISLRIKALGGGEINSRLGCWMCIITRKYLRKLWRQANKGILPLSADAFVAKTIRKQGAQTAWLHCAGILGRRIVCCILHNDVCNQHPGKGK